MFILYLFLYLFQAQRFWQTEEFAAGAEIFLFVCLGLVLLALVVAALYLSYLMISKWVVKCRKLSDELDLFEERLRIGHQINQESLAVFHQVLQRYRVENDVEDQPPRGASPMWLSLGKKLNRETMTVEDRGIEMKDVTEFEGGARADHGVENEKEKPKTPAGSPKPKCG